ncbi:hypothetical protein D9M70_358820 [compost metagenome]
MKDIFRTVSTGLSGTPMPSFSDTVSEDDRWALAYFVLSLSAYTDPLTGQPLPIPPEQKAALNDPGLRAEESRQAYRPPAADAPEQPGQPSTYAGEAWARRHGFAFADER